MPKTRFVDSHAHITHPYFIKVECEHLIVLLTSSSGKLKIATLFPTSHTYSILYTCLSGNSSVLIFLSGKGNLNLG